MDFFSELKFKEVAKEIAAVGPVLYRRGLAPASGGSFSMRINETAYGITQAGRDKEKLKEQDVVAVDFDGKPLTKGRPAPEAVLHTLLYRRFGETGAILDIHSHNSTVLSRMLKGQSRLILKDYEMLKTFRGVSAHDTELIVPIFENARDVKALSENVENYLETPGVRCHGFLIRGHGLYVWGTTMADALRYLDAFEFLSGCEIILHRPVPSS